MERTPEDILDECIERLAGGEPVETLLAAYPRHAAALTPALRSARMLLSAPVAEAADAARLAAMRRMLDQLEASSKPAVGGGWLAAFKRRPVAFQAAALAGSIALFGALGVGASAATGTAPEPVRDLFRLTSSSQIRVEFTGVVTGMDLVAGTLQVSAAGDVRTVRVTASTEISRGGDAIGLDGLTVGDVVEVKGALQTDNSVLAKRVHLEDDEDDATGTPGADPTAGAGTPDDADDVDGDSIDDDNSGPGSGDGDGSGPSDNSGPGNDDGIDDGNSGPGSGDDGGTPQPDSSGTPDTDDDNSGPGGGDDDDGTPHPEDTPVPGG